MSPFVKYLQDTLQYESNVKLHPFSINSPLSKRKIKWKAKAKRIGKKCYQISFHPAVDAELLVRGGNVSKWHPKDEWNMLYDAEETIRDELAKQGYSVTVKYSTIPKGGFSFTTVMNLKVDSTARL